MRLHRTTTLVLACLLCACGGGNGGSGLRFSKKSLTLTSDPDANGHDSIELSGWQGTLFVLAEPDRQDWICVLDWTETVTGARMDVTSCPPSELGTYRGAITLWACADPGCATSVAGSPFRIPYELVVRHTLRADTGGVTLRSVAGAQSEEYGVQVQLPDGASSFDLRVVEPASWLQITQHAATSFAVRARPMQEGTYRTSLRLAAGPDVLVLPVEYVVETAPATVAPAHLDLRLASGATGTGTLRLRLMQPDTSYAVQFVPAVPWLRVSRQSATELELTVTPLPHGRYHASVWITSDHSMMTVPIYVEVTATPDEPELGATPRAVSLTAVPGGASSVQHLAVTLPSWSPTISRYVSYRGNASGWLVVTPVPGGLDLQADAAALAPGGYSATLSLCGWPDTQREVSVALTVGEGLLQLPDQIVPITVTTTAAELTREVPIRSTNGQSYGWAASSSWWAQVDTPTGTTETPLRFHVEPSALAGPWNGSRRDSIRLRYDPPSASSPAFDFGVVYLKDLPEVRFTAPSAQPAGRPMRLRLFGRGFSRVPDLASRLQVGGTRPTSLEVLDDTRLVVEVPALSPGVYPVAVRNDLESPVAAAPVRVFGPGDYPYARVGLPGEKRGVLFDPYERVIYVADVENAVVVRLAFDGTQWRRSERFLPDLQDIGLSPDGGTLFAAMYQSVHLLDPSTLADRAVKDYPGNDYPYFYSYNASSTATGLLVSDDGRVYWRPNESPFAGSWSCYDLAANSFSGFETDFPFAAKAGSVSRDGHRLVFSNLPDAPIVFADSDDGVPRMSDTFRAFAHASQSDDGDRVILDGSDVYDGRYLWLGRASLPSGYETRGAVLSPAGDRAYVLGYPSTFATSATPGPRVFVFDTASPVTASGFPVLRSFDLPDYPTCRDPYRCDPWPRIVLSPDESTLILAGDAGILVAPVP